MSPSSLRRKLGIVGPQIATPCGTLRKVINGWLDKPITEGFFMEGTITLLVGLSTLLPDEFYGPRILLAFLYVFFALLKTIAVRLEMLNFALEAAMESNDNCKNLSPDNPAAPRSTIRPKRDVDCKTAAIAH